MKIFITGGTGFIGQHLVPLLAEHTVLVLTRGPSRAIGSHVQHVAGDLSEASWHDTVKAFAPDAALHLAWRGIPDYSPATSAENMIAGVRLMQFLSTTSCKNLVGTGSLFELMHDNAFAAAKKALCSFGEQFAKECGTRFSWARIFWVYGPGQRAGALIPHLISTVNTGDTPDIKTPDTENDCIFVDDVARALRALLESDARGIFDLGSGTLTPVRRIVEEVYASMEKELVWLPESTSVQSPRADTSRLYAATGWQPQISIEKGVRLTVEHARRQL